MDETERGQITDASTTRASTDVVRLAESAPFRVGSITADPPARTIITDDGASERIEPRLMQVLTLLAAARGTVVSRGAINAACWEGRHVSNDALDRVISRLRACAAGIGGHSFAIETLPRVGFRLTETITEKPVVTAKPTRRGVIIGALAGGTATVVGGATLLSQTWRHDPTLGNGAIRIAVLPFEVDPPDRLARRFALGTARELRELFARVAGVSMIAANSSIGAWAATGSAEAAGRRLEARFVIAGSVETAEDRARVKAALMDPATGKTLATAQAEGTAEQVFAVQDAIKARLLRELVGRTGVSTPPERGAPATDSRAYQLAIEAQDLVERARAAKMGGRSEEAFDLADRAEAGARASLAITPEYPAALLVLAELTRYGWTRDLAVQSASPEQRVETSIGYVTRALVVDPNDPGALTALGDYYRRYRWRFDEAETLFRKALAINPSFVEAHWSYGYQLGTLGRALEGLTHAAQVSRLDPETTWRRVALPRLLYLCGDRTAARRHYRDELRATPANLFLITEIYLMALTENDPVSIEALGETVTRLNQGLATPEPLTKLLTKLRAAARALRGDRGAFVATIDREVTAFDAETTPEYTSQGRASVDLLYLYAVEYAWAGAQEKSLRLLDRALAAHSLYWPATLPCGLAEFPAPIRDSAAFKAVWNRDLARIDVVRRRRAALLSRQMEGRLSNVGLVRPSTEDIQRAIVAAGEGIVRPM